MLNGALGGVFNAAAAGHFHAHNGYAADFILRNNGGQLFGIVAFIKLGAADERNAALHEIMVEGCISICGAVGGDEQVGVVEVGSVHRHQFDLHGPLHELTLNRLRAGVGHRGRGGGLKAAGHGAGAAAGGSLRLECLCLFYSGFIVGGSFAHFKADGVCRARGETIAQSVAVILAGEPGLAVHHFNGAFMAGRCAGAAAVALVFINPDNLSEHVCNLHLKWFVLAFAGSVYYNENIVYVEFSTKGEKG